MRRALVVVLAVVLVIAGGVMVWRSTSGSEPAAAPVPSQTFDVASPTPDRTRSADVVAIPDDVTSTGRASGSSTAGPSPSTGSASTVAMSPGRMGPERLYVPSLGIYASLSSVAFGGGSLTIPREPWRVGIDVGSSPLGSTVGTTLLAGHVDLSGTPGALASLADADPGAMVYVTDDEGNRSSFVTDGLQSYSKVSLPRSIFDVEGPRRLAVVTCGGPIMEVDGQRHYRDNVVLTAAPAATTKGPDRGGRGPSADGSDQKRP